MGGKINYLGDFVFLSGQRKEAAQTLSRVLFSPEAPSAAVF